MSSPTFWCTDCRAHVQLAVDGRQGAISDELLDWGNELRFLGNIGAHPTDDIVSREDATEAVEFLSAIIETIYHLRPKFQAMKARRAKAAQQRNGLPAPEESEAAERPPSRVSIDASNGGTK